MKRSISPLWLLIRFRKHPKCRFGKNQLYDGRFDVYKDIGERFLELSNESG